MSNSDFATIFAAGTLTYGISFIVNGPFTDKFGGRRAILISAIGAAIANALMGYLVWSGQTEDLVFQFSVLYSVNMYFQSFGAVSVVKVNSAWFHVRERGVFGAIFGILISLGIYFAFDIGRMITLAFPTEWVFFIPTIALLLFALLDFLFVRDNPELLGFPKLRTGDATDGDDGPRLSTLEVFKRMLTNPVILTIAGIEFCSGFLRQAIMQWYRIFAKQTGADHGFVYDNWGLLLCCAGILGGVFAGIISDRVFQSRRGPVASVLYGIMLVGGIILIFTYKTPLLGALVVVMSMAVIGVHGMLSGTASADFGGSKNTGTAVGIIDGFVYAGTGFMSILYGYILPKGELAQNPDNWFNWPLAMVPIAAIGFFLALRVWNAKPKAASK